LRRSGAGRVDDLETRQLQQYSSRVFCNWAHYAIDQRWKEKGQNKSLAAIDVQDCLTLERAIRFEESIIVADLTFRALEAPGTAEQHAVTDQEACARRDLQMD
jgi:hypothetical protein